MTWGTYLQGIGAGVLAIAIIGAFGWFIVWCCAGRWWRMVLGLLVIVHILAFRFILSYGST